MVLSATCGVACTWHSLSQITHMNLWLEASSPEVLRQVRELFETERCRRTFTA